MLIHSIDRNNRSCYIIQNVFAWNEAIRVDIFESAWQELANRHEALRSRFEWKNTPTPLQIVEDLASVQFEIWQDVALDEFLEQDLERGFALDDAPPWRVTALRQPDGSLTAVWTFHHLLLDGRSHIVLLRELLAIYDGLLAGTLVVGKAEVPHRLHADWLAAQDVTYAQEFWKDYLKGSPAGGGEFPKPATPIAGPVRYASYDTRLGRGLTAELKAFSAQTRFTIGNIVQVSWAFVLGWLSNRNDVVIGAVRAARKSGVSGGEDLIGLMINTMPLRVTWRADSSIESVLNKVAQDWKDFRSYEQTPLQAIQGWLKLTSGRELFRSVLSYSAPHFLDAVFSGSAKREGRYIWLRQTTPYCSLDASLDHDDMTLSLNLPTHLVDPGIASRLGEYLTNTVRGVISNPLGRVSDLAPLSGEDRAYLTRGLNTRWEGPPETIDWMSRIRLHAEHQPGDEAIGGWDGSFSWEQLEQRSNQVAAFVAERQAGAGAVIAVFLPRSSEFIWTCLGIMKAGAAYLPLDVQWPAQRVEAVLKDARPLAIISGALAVPELAEAVIPLWDLRQLPPAAGIPEKAHAPESRQLAYVIYTSGSSGTPKGVEVTQGGLQNLIEDTIATFEVGPDTRGCFLSNTAFDASVHEVWPLLAAGAGIHLPPANLLADPAGLLRWMVEKQITFAFVSVIIAEALTQMARVRASSLRYLLTGGDQLRVAAPEELGFALVNEYGPTEYTVVATRYPVPPQFEGVGGIPIGKPVRGTRTYVMNEWQQLLPAGVAGELVLAGHGLARGYRYAPELTGQKFVRNPLPEEPSEKLYRTGDLVRWREDGNLQFLGRIDSQVKLRGFRIELGEIEATLLKHPAIAEAVVMMKNEPAPRLVAFVVPGPAAGGMPLNGNPANHAALKGDLMSHLKAVLPEYMVPAEFAFVAQLPVNSSGKYDRKQIAALVMEVPDAPKGRLPTVKQEFASQREAEMAAVWSEVLSVGEVAPDDRFLSLGGTSLSIIRLICAIDQKFGAEIPATELFRDPTPGDLVRFIEASGAQKAGPLVRLGDNQEAGSRGSSIPLRNQRSAPPSSPVFLIPGAGGGIHWFRDLADALGSEHPAYGVELLALSQDVQDHFSVDRAASEIVELVRPYADSGELSFCAYSGGGLIAIECARRLTAEGKRIGALCLLDTYLPPRATGRLAQAERWLRGWWSLPMDRRIPMLVNRVSWLWRHRQQTAAVPSPAQRTMALSKQTHIDAFKRHQLAPYNGEVDLFFAEDRPLSVGASIEQDWRAFLTGPLRVSHLPGDHYSLLLPHNARRLAEYFHVKLQGYPVSERPSEMFT